MKTNNNLSRFVNPRLQDPYMESMNFLNEVSIIYPDAISFGSGRPDQNYFDVREVASQMDAYIESCGHQPEDNAGSNQLGQYNKTKGIINQHIANLLRNDEQIDVSPEDIIIINGAQEGMVIVIDTIFHSPDDVLLVSDPSYIGFVGYAKIAGLEIVPVRRDEDSVCLDHLKKTLERLKQEGKPAKALYEVPDFHNPTGTYMPLEKRKKLLDMAEEHDFLVVEDNPYGYFIYETDKIPTLKALDRNKRVIHLGSFSKSIFPAVRMGFLVADQEMTHNGKTIKLIDECKKTKSFVSVNTSTILQAMVGGFLEERNYALKEYNRQKVEAVRQKRDLMARELERHFKDLPNGNGISWKVPIGGFFLVVDLPFKVTDHMLLECVKDYGAIFCPMTYFSLIEGTTDHQIRLAFSCLSHEKIKEGISRLASFIKDKLNTANTAVDA